MEASEETDSTVEIYESENRVKTFLKLLLISLGLCLNFTCAFLAAIIFQLSFPSFLILILFFSFLGGLAVANVEKGTIITLLALSAGIFTAGGLYLSMPLLEGDAFMVNFLVEELLNSLAPHFIFGLICTIMGALVGNLLGEAIFK